MLEFSSGYYSAEYLGEAFCELCPEAAFSRKVPMGKGAHPTLLVGTFFTSGQWVGHTYRHTISQEAGSSTNASKEGKRGCSEGKTGTGAYKRTIAGSRGSAQIP